MKRICTITARGGSKGVKDKNLRQLAGKPLLGWSVEQAKASGLFDAIVINSDSEAILETGKAYGADLALKRPDELASDTAAKIPAIRWGVEEAERILGLRFDTCVDLDATSPLRDVSDIKGAVALLEAGAGIVITAAPSRRSPYFNMVELDETGAARLVKPLDKATVRRQDAPKCFDMNASIYVWEREVLAAEDKLFLPTTKLFEMPEIRSMDIDSELDFQMVSYLFEQKLL